MKNWLTALIIATASARAGATDELVKTCQIAAGASNVVKVTRANHFYDSYVYTLHYSGKKAYFFDDENGSRSASVKLMCVGKKERAFVAYGEFTAGSYLQGFVLLFNQMSGKIERLDFAEKGPPEWLYLGEKEAIVVAPTYGRGENGGKPYAAYRHIKGRNDEPEPEGLVVPTPPPGFTAIKLVPQG